MNKVVIEGEVKRVDGARIVLSCPSPIGGHGDVDVVLPDGLENSIRTGQIITVEGALVSVNRTVQVGDVARNAGARIAPSARGKRALIQTLAVMAQQVTQAANSSARGRQTYESMLSIPESGKSA